jgi:glycosyltransferase involved in cell wall biosynthesis
MTLHLIAPFHIEPAIGWSHDAFGTLTRLFGRMMRGAPLVEYSNGESEALERVQILSHDELRTLAPHEEGQEYRHQARLDSELYRVWESRLRAVLQERIHPGDIVLHGFGRQSSWVLGGNPGAVHIEPWVGYDESPWGAIRIYPSAAWRGYLQGRYQTPPSDYDRVIPHPIDPEEWDGSDSHEGGHLLYMGRLIPGKGLNVLKAIADSQSRPILCVGQGDPRERAPFQHPRLVYLPPVSGRERALLYCKARAVIMPTRYVEPFGMVSAEAQASGAPVLGSPHGGIAETVIHGETGWICHTLGDYLEGIDRAPELDRGWIRDSAMQRFGFTVVRALYERAFDVALTTWGDGWYTRKGYL